MKHPLWLINTILLIASLATICFIIFDRPALPRRVPLFVKSKQESSIQPSISVSIEKIYENDLFDTYHKTLAPVVEQDFSTPLPPPPAQTQITIPSEPLPSFLQPLEFKLKGAICVDDESMNRAIIADNKTTIQKNYRVGDTIQDARLVKILPNRIILIRSNGQQETLYLNEKDLEKNPITKEQSEHWLHIVKKIKGDEYLFDHEMFAHITQNVAQCIDMFDATTVYLNGKSIGCKIGFIEPGSLGSAMGFESYDSIIAIDSLPLATAQERIALFEHLKTKAFHELLTIDIIRNKESVKLFYRLHDLKDPMDDTLIQAAQDKKTYPGIIDLSDVEDIEEEKLSILKQRYEFAPTIQEIKIEQKAAMLSKEKKESDSRPEGE